MTLSLDPRLLDTSRGALTASSEFNAINEAHGLYDGLRSVVRLSPLVHDLIASLPPGIGYRSGMSWEQVQAFSTYLHETIHWWQHVGSTCGLMLSLSYPAQTHANLNHLREFLGRVGPLKSILDFARSMSGPSTPDTPAGLANIIVNNQFDIHAYRFLATNPERAEPLIQSGMFESPGHAYEIAIGQALNLIASTFDRDLTFVPDFRKWERSFRALRRARHPDFTFGATVELSPIGAYQIFEGQARFAQIQYLHFASGGRFEFDDAQNAGMLSESYTMAFDVFVHLTGLDRPATIDHSTVALFLLVCDLAINPGEGFPFAISDFAGFLKDVDPGVRFFRLCLAVKQACPEIGMAITTYSFADYENISERLCTALNILSPLAICREIARWVETSDDFRDCLARHDAGLTSDFNPPVDLLFGQFLSFARDKLRLAHILCWPGANMAGERAGEDAPSLFSRQSPLFIDRADDSMIVPILRSGLAEDDVHQSFQRFYDGHALYDLTQQWITRSGPFTYRFHWLQPNGTEAEVKAWADHNFWAAYGISPDEFTVLADTPEL
jgi:hypothetical protein